MNRFLINNLVVSVNLIFTKGLWKITLPEVEIEERFPTLDKALGFLTLHCIPDYGDIDEVVSFTTPSDSSEAEEWAHLFPLATEEIPF